MRDKVSLLPTRQLRALSQDSGNKDRAAYSFPEPGFEGIQDCQSFEDWQSYRSPSLLNLVICNQITNQLHMRLTPVERSKFRPMWMINPK
jgi:hypothetical protein